MTSQKSPSSNIEASSRHLRPNALRLHDETLKIFIHQTKCIR